MTLILTAMLLLFSATLAFSAERSRPPASPHNENRLSPKMLSLSNTIVPTGSPASPLGTNLGPVVDWSTQLPFVDAFKMARTWITHCADTDPDCDQVGWDTGEADLIDLDENGWVISLPAPEDEPIFTRVGTVLLLGDAEGQNNLAGQYTVLYDGEGTIEYGGGASKDEGASSPGHDVVDVSATGFVHLMITQTDPNNTGDYIRNIRFIMPGFEETYQTQIFNPVFLEKLANFRVLRFMDWMRTNDEPAGEWAERSQVSDYTYTTNNGVPLKIMIELSNRTQTAPWFNMPHTATDEYVTEFATMVRDNLSDTLRVYLEYSNETWNSQFQQAISVTQQGLAEFDTTDPVRAGLNWHGKQAAEMCEIWKTVWGGQSERVICIAASQAAQTWKAEEVLSCPLWTEGAPCVEHGLDALAIAPYFGGYLGYPNFEAQVQTWTLDQLFTEIFTGGLLNDGGALLQAYQWMSDTKTVADSHSVELIAYEGGQHLVGIGGVVNNQAITNLFTNANRDPRMGQAYSQYFTEWRNRGGCLFANYTLVQREYNQHGSWGILEYINQTSSPKYEAVMGFVNDNPGLWENCATIGQIPLDNFIYLPAILKP